MEIVLAALFALIAGAGTAVSPCVLPVLPLALSGAAHRRAAPAARHRGRPGGVVCVRDAGARVRDRGARPSRRSRCATSRSSSLLVFGVRWWSRRWRPASRAGCRGSCRRRRPSAAGTASAPGVLLGAVARPALRALRRADPRGGADRPGLAGPQRAAARHGPRLRARDRRRRLLVLTAGRRLLGRLRANAGRLQQGMGAIMVLFAVLTLAGADGKFRTVIADALPSLARHPDREAREGRSPRRRSASSPSSGYRTPARRRSSTARRTWLNSEPLTLAGLRGRVVLIDFWTYTCINCIRTQPYLKAWDAKYRDDGLTIVGVHTPEFAFEQRAPTTWSGPSARPGSKYPVAQDNDFGDLERLAATSTGRRSTCRRARPRALRRLRRGRLRGNRGRHPQAARRGGARRTAGRPAPVTAQRPAAGTRTPETYLGPARAQGWTQDPSGGRARLRPGARDPAAQLVRTRGIWTLGPRERQGGPERGHPARLHGPAGLSRAGRRRARAA